MRAAAWPSAPRVAADRARLHCEGLEGRTLLSVSTDARGFTVVTPSADSRIIYVSTSGSDANSGLDMGHPVATLAQAKALTRSGFPDEILLRRGDVFYNQNLAAWDKSGRSASEPFLIGAYTDPNAPSMDRPKVASGLINGIGFSTATQLSNIYVLGVAFEANTRNYRDPGTGGTTFTTDVLPESIGGTYGVRVLGNLDNLQIEDCSFQYYRTNITLQTTVLNGVTRVASNIRVRRNEILDAYSPDIDPTGQQFMLTSEGVYAEGVQNLTVDGNVLDHNGWSDNNALGGSATQWNHDLYLNINNTNVVVTNNFISNAGAHGLQMRAGGVVTNNVFLRNPIGMSFGFVNGIGTVGGVSGVVSNNAFLEDRDIAGAKRGYSLEMANLKPISQGGGTLVSNNIFAADTQNSFATIRLDVPQSFDNPQDQVGINDLTLDGNLVYSWYRGLYINSKYQPGGGVQGYGLNNLTVRNNDFQRQQTGAIVESQPAINLSTETFVNTRYDSVVSDSTNPWFKVAFNNVNASTWKSIYEPTAMLATGAFPDPTRGVGKYNSTLGGGSTTDDFIAELRRQSSQFWRTSYTTDPVLDYIRTGFTGGKIDLSGPTASATATNTTIAGSPSKTITVTYSDDNKLNTASIGTGDILVTGPGNFSAVGTLVSSTGPSDGSRRTATYTIAAPNGAWTAAANGQYTISLQPGEVLDVTGKSGVDGAIGSFSVAIDPAVPSAVASAPSISLDSGAATVTVTYTGAAIPSLPTSVSPVNAGFETPAVGTDDPNAFLSQPANSGWSWGGSAGIAGNNSTYTTGIATAPQGTQVAYLQNAGSAMSQTISNWQAGTYTISFQAAQRGSGMNASVQDVQVFVDGQSLGTFTPNADGTYQTFATAQFTVAAGSHTVNFVGLDSAGGENTALIDNIQIGGMTTASQQLISAASLDTSDITLNGPNGYVGTPTSATPDVASDGITRVVTYTIPAPSGSWSSVGNGSYAINSVGGQVLTNTTATVPAGKIGSLAVAVNAPSAAVAVGNVTAGSTAAQVFTVTYTDNNGIDPNSIDNADLRVTGPGSFNNPVTLIGTNGGAGTAASPLVATYQVAAPAAGWTSSGNGTYWIVAQSNQVIDVGGNALPSGAIGSFRVAIDVTAPVNWNSEQDITFPAPLGGSSPTKTIGVSYYDSSGINTSMLDNNDIQITGPNGYVQTLTIATPTTSNIFTSATSAFVNYVMQPPVGGWKSSYNGVYSVVLLPGAVADKVGNAITSPRTISQFNVALETDPPLPVVASITTPRNSALSSINITFRNTSAGTTDTVTGFDLSDLTLTRSGVAVSLSGATLSTSDNITWTLGNLAGLTGSSGNYVLTVKGSGTGVVDLAGNAQVSGASATWTVDLTPPTTSGAFASTITQPSTAAQTITVNYADNLGLNTATFDSGDIYVSGPNGYFATATFISSSGSSTSRTATYTIPAPGGGWKSAYNGAYTITLQNGQVADSAGNFVTGGAIGSFSVSLETTPPTVSIAPVSNPPAGVSVSSVTITFSEAVGGFDVSDLSLARDGTAVSLAGATLSTGDNVGFTLGNLSGITSTPGNYTLTLSAAGSGITDLAGNALSAGASVGFTITAPIANFADGGFETPALADGDYATAPAGSPWSFSASSGITTNWTPYTGANPPAPQGRQVAFITRYGSISQTINGITTGSYVITFQAAQRKNDGEPNQVVDVRVDDVSVGTFQPSDDGLYHGISTAPFSVAAGSHSIALVGLDPTASYNTIFLDSVQLSPALAAQVGPVQSPQSGGLASVPISFNRAVSGFDLSDLSLSRDGNGVSLAGATLSSSDGQNYTLTGLTNATSASGTYTLTLTATGSGIQDAQGVPLFTDASGSWTTLAAPTPAISGIAPNPVAGSPFLQDLTINGTNFTADDAVTLTNTATSTTISGNVISRSATQLVVRAAFGTSAANWTAQVSGSTGSSGQAAFSVNDQTPINVSVSRSSAGKSVSLSVQNAVGVGLTYYWSTTSAPSGAPQVSFSNSGTASAANTTATFGQAGTYTLSVLVTDGINFVSVPVTVTMTQQLTGISVTPATATVFNSKTLQLKAQTVDQFGLPMAAQPGSFSWSRVSGIGTISSTGLYTAPSSGTGSTLIKAASGTLSGTATITVATSWKLWVDFVPSSASVVSGYQRDGGSVYGTRSTSYTYGWNVSHTDVVNDRNKTSNQIVDTSIGVKSGGKWEASVANGTYSVLIGIGDSAISTTNTVRVEGTTIFNAVKLSPNTYKTATVTVTVTDGRLTIDAGSSNLTTRLTYLKITRLS
jgi:hypothetical protein